MKIPEKIKLGGFNITVKKERHLIIERNELGNYRPRIQQITIDEDNTDQQQEETLIHEILEAITCHYDVDIEHHKLSVIATVLHQVLKDNDLNFN